MSSLLSVKAAFGSLCLASVFLSVQAKVTDYLPQSYYFNWDTTTVPVPVTTQCETIHVTWDRSTATGPNPTAPYYLQIYTSAYIFPFIVDAGSGLSTDFQVPFAPGTLYQICMFDKNGNTGGCQDTYAVIANQTSTELSCSNSTLSFPLGPLDVDAQVTNGPLSQYGWVDQCTDIMVTPKNGTPPYIFTAAPSLHPPYNITSQDGSSINWTVTLSWAMPFFISVADSAGNYWSNGPLHSGGGGSTSCLSGSDSNPVSTPAAVGIGVGGIVAGLLAGFLGAFCFYRKRARNSRTDTFTNLASPHPSGLNYSLSTSARYDPVPSPFSASHVIDGSMGSQGSGHALLGPQDTQYQVEPFIMPGEQRQRSPSNVHDINPLSGTISETGVMTRTSSNMQNQVYVVHHDGGRAPVTVYHQDGTEVVELPPRYANDSEGAEVSHTQGGSSGSGWRESQSDARSGSDGRSNPPISPTEGPMSSPFQQQRRPDSTPRKRARESSTQSRT